jgi:hypothetical protein
MRSSIAQIRMHNTVEHTNSPYLVSTKLTPAAMKDVQPIIYMLIRNKSVCVY